MSQTAKYLPHHSIFMNEPANGNKIRSTLSLEPIDDYVSIKQSKSIEDKRNKRVFKAKCLLLTSFALFFTGPTNAQTAPMGSGLLVSPFASASTVPIKILTPCEVLYNSLSKWLTQPVPTWENRNGTWSISATVTETTQTAQSGSAVNLVRIGGDFLINHAYKYTNSNPIKSINIFAELQTYNWTAKTFPEPNRFYSFMIADNGAFFVQTYADANYKNPTSIALGGQFQCQDNLMWAPVGEVVYAISFKKLDFEPEGIIIK